MFCLRWNLCSNIEYEYRYNLFPKVKQIVLIEQTKMLFSEQRKLRGIRVGSCCDFVIPQVFDFNRSLSGDKVGGLASMAGVPVEARTQEDDGALLKQAQYTVSALFRIIEHHTIPIFSLLIAIAQFRNVEIAFALRGLKWFLIPHGQAGTRRDANIRDQRVQTYRCPENISRV